jgi:tetratricopeptide (TPR) repeat protein
MTSEENSKIVRSSQQKISIYSSEMIKRGFDLALKIYPKIVEKSNKSETYKWEHIYNIIHPQNKKISVAITSDTKIIVAIDAWGTINIWDSESGCFLHQPFLGHKKEVPIPGEFLYDIIERHYRNLIEDGGHFDIAITQDNQKVVSIGNQEIKVWSLKKRELIYLIPNAYEVKLYLNRDILVYKGRDEKISILNIESKSIISEIETGFTNIEYFALSQNSQCLVVSGSKLIGGNWEEDEYINEHSIKIWNFPKNDPVQINDFVDTENTRFSPQVFVNTNGKVVVSIDERNQDIISSGESLNSFFDKSYIASIWNAENGKLLYKIELEDDSIELNNTEELIHYSEENNEIQFRNLWTGELVKTINKNPSTNTFSSTSDGKTLASVSYENQVNNIHIWNVNTSQSIYEHVNLKTSVRHLNFNQGGKALISANYDGSSDIWKLNENAVNSELLKELTSFEFQVISEDLISEDPKNFLQNGIDHYNQKQYSHSIRNLTMALDYDPQNGYAFIYRARAQYGLGNNQDAIEDYSKMLAINPGYVEIYYERGLVHSEAGNFLAALEDYSQAININPKFQDAYNRRSTVRSALGDIQGAIEDLQKVKDLLY